MLSPSKIARRLGGQVVGWDRVLAPGPGHSRHDRSLSIRFDHRAPDGFWVNSFASDDWQMCRDHVRTQLGISTGLPPVDHGFRPIAADAPPAVHTAGDLTLLARRLWDEAFPITGTPAAAYLATRGLHPPTEALEGDALRFHPSCPFKLESGERVRLPTLLGAMRDIQTDSFRGVHRTALSPDGTGKATLPGLGNPKKMLGPAANACIKLTPDEDVGLGLHIAEGIETALACIASGFKPIWATLSAGQMARFPVLSGVECLTLFADHDKSGTGLSAARTCAQSWTRAGAEVVILYRDTLGLDFADPAGVPS